jgi:glycerol kinase
VALVLQRTGLRIVGYFSATKVRWVLYFVPGGGVRAQGG